MPSPASTTAVRTNLSQVRQQVRRVRQLVEATGNSLTYREFPDMPDSMHGHDPATYVNTVTTWLARTTMSARTAIDG